MAYQSEAQLENKSVDEMVGMVASHFGLGEGELK